MIPPEKVEEVKAATDIVDVVSDYVKLKRAGSNWKGLCPFHNEKTPSFNVNPSMGIYKCFGCGAGGDAIAFVEKIEGLSFIEALRQLAERAGIELPEEEGPRQSDETEAVLHALRFAAKFYFRQLTQTDEGRARGLAYFKQRGFSKETIKRFGLGWAPDRWDALLEAAAAEHIKPEVLEQAGLVLPRKSGDGYYDRFRGRVVFPILSHVGKVLGFGGRILDPDTDQPKYINSPETRVYHKSRVLYGLYQGKQAIRAEEEAILVEGYTDVISLYQAGVQNVVASSGTALTPEQVKALGRYAKRVLLLYDADTAGASAALRGIDLVLREGLAAYVVSLPDQADPDSFVQQFGGEAFRNYVRKERQSFVQAQVAAARREGLLQTPEGQAETAERILTSIGQIPDPIAQNGYLQVAAEHLGVPDIELRMQFRKLLKDPPPERRREPVREGPPPEHEGRPEPPRQRPRPITMRPEEGMLLRLMLEHGVPMVEHVLGHMAVGEFSEGPVRETIQHLLAQYEAGRVDAEPFTRGDFGEAVQRITTGVLVDQHAVSENWRRAGIAVPTLNGEPYEAAASAMTLLKLDRVNDAINHQHRRIYQAEQAGEDLTPLQQEMQQLQTLRLQIERRQFLSWNEDAEG